MSSVIAVGALLAVGLLAACGGGASSAGSTSGSTTSKSGGTEPTRPATGAWADRANAICRANKGANEAAVEELGMVMRRGLTTPKARDEAAELVRAGVVRVEREIVAFARVAPPAALEGSFEEMIGQVQGIVGLEKRFADALEFGGVYELKDLTLRLLHRALRIHAIADRLGLPDCGRLMGFPDHQTLA